MSTYTEIQTFKTITCCVAGCGIGFAMTDDYYAARERDGGQWYCPNGHRQHFTTTIEHKLRAELDQMKSDRDWQKRRREFAERDAEFARRQASARKGQLTKIRKRIAAGVCPVPGCKRSGFNNVAKHIASMHPDFHDHEDGAS